MTGVSVKNGAFMHDLFCLEVPEAKKIHISTFFVDKIVMKHVGLSPSY